MRARYSRALFERPTALCCCTAFVFWTLAPGAYAQPTSRTAVLGATAGSVDLQPLAGAIERVLRSDLDALRVTINAGTPALPLSDLQLALGCVGETPQCLAAVAKQLQVDLLILTHVERVADQTVLTVGLFDSQREVDARRVSERASGPNHEAALLESVDGLLRQLYGLPPAPPKQIAEIDRDPGRVPWPSIAAGGVALAAFATGIGFYAAGNATETEYAMSPTNTPPMVDATLSLLDRGQGQMTAANVFFVVGAVAVATGVVLWFLPAGEDEPLEASP